MPTPYQFPQPKDPREHRDRWLDLSKDIAAGDSIAGTPTVSITHADGTAGVPNLMVVGPARVSGGKVFFKLMGGAVGVTYNIRVTVMTVLGDTISHSADLLVDDQ